jgi:hypothetical protein
MAYDGGVNPNYQIPMSSVASAATAKVNPSAGGSVSPESAGLEKQLDDIQKIIGPVQHPQSQNIPMNMPQPAHAGEIPLNMRSNRTASGSKTNSMLTAVQGVSQIIRAVKQKKEEKDGRLLQFDMERLMGAKNALATLDPKDPNNAEAIKTNNQIIDDITSDPKKAKRIEKALDIHLLDPSKNSKESQATIKAAQSTQQKGQQQQGGQGSQQQANPHREAILRALQMPQTQGMNPNLTALMALAKTGLIVTPKQLSDQQNKIDVAKEHSKGLEGSAKIRANATIGAAELHAQAAKSLEDARASHNLNRDSLRHIQKLGEIAAALAGRAKLIGMKGGAGSSDKRLKADNMLLGMVDKNIKETEAMLKAADDKITNSEHWYGNNKDALAAAQTEKKNLTNTLSILRANKQELLTDANTAAQGVGSEGITESVDELLNGFDIPGEDDAAEDSDDGSDSDSSE